MNCNNCGAPINPGETICRNCGNPINNGGGMNINQNNAAGMFNVPGQTNNMNINPTPINNQPQMNMNPIPNNQMPNQFNPNMQPPINNQNIDNMPNNPNMYPNQGINTINQMPQGINQSMPNNINYQNPMNMPQGMPNNQNMNPNMNQMPNQVQMNPNSNIGINPESNPPKKKGSPILIILIIILIGVLGYAGYYWYNELNNNGDTTSNNDSNNSSEDNTDSVIPTLTLGNYMFVIPDNFTYESTETNFTISNSSYAIVLKPIALKYSDIVENTEALKNAIANDGVTSDSYDTNSYNGREYLIAIGTYSDMPINYFYTSLDENNLLQGIIFKNDNVENYDDAYNYVNELIESVSTLNTDSEQNSIDDLGIGEFSDTYIKEQLTTNSETVPNDAQPEEVEE